MDVMTSRTIIHPSDLDRSLAFYGRRHSDLPVAREFGSGGTWPRGVVFFAGGGLIEVVGSSPGPAGAGRRRPRSGRWSAVALWLQVRVDRRRRRRAHRLGAWPVVRARSSSRGA